MGQLMNEIKTVKKYDELINDAQERLEMLQELRKKLIKEQWTIIRITFHKKYYHDKDYELIVEYKDLNKEFYTTEILFEKLSKHNIKIFYKDIEVISYIKRKNVSIFQQ